jgi:hypothetical protein
MYFLGVIKNHSNISTNRKMCTLHEKLNDLDFYEKFDTIASFLILNFKIDLRIERAGLL